MQPLAVAQIERVATELAHDARVARVGGRDEDRARCRAAGFDDHVTKPLDLRELERIVSRAAAQ